MKAVFSAALLAGALLLMPANAAAAPIRYQITFGATATEPAGGIGFFFRDDVTGLLSGFSWDFGGNTGGIVDASVDWSAPTFGGTLSDFVFEILTLQDVSPAACTDLNNSCSHGFGGPQLFGYPGDQIFFRDQLNTNAQLYVLGANGPEGSFSTQLAPRVVVPEPGTLALLALGMCGTRQIRRRRLSGSSRDVEAGGGAPTHR